MQTSEKLTEPTEAFPGRKYVWVEKTDPTTDCLQISVLPPLLLGFFRQQFKQSRECMEHAGWVFRTVLLVPQASDQNGGGGGGVG